MKFKFTNLEYSRRIHYRERKKMFELFKFVMQKISVKEKDLKAIYIVIIL